MTRTQVAIVGAGPAGLLLGHLLDAQGVATIILERQSRAHVEARIRAGVLEQATTDLLDACGLGERMRRLGLIHRGIELAFGERRHRVDFQALAGGRSVMVYGQHDVVKDLIAARLAAARPLVFEAEDVTLSGVDGERPQVQYRRMGSEQAIEADFIAGCDGFHGVSRGSIPPGVLSVYERAYPFAWLGVLVEAKPAQPELIYSRHERGFALFSMRSPELTRLYLQCAPNEDLSEWPDARIFEELHERLEVGGGFALNEGRILQKGITQMRSFVCEPMQFGRLFLAGDAAHIVPPTGAKGMNLAVADVFHLARAIGSYYRTASTQELGAYSQRCLSRIWSGQRFSTFMTSLLHKAPGASAFDTRLQLAELDHLVGSPNALRALAEGYVGLPLA